MDCQLTAIILGGGGVENHESITEPYGRIVTQTKSFDSIPLLPPFPPAINSDQSLNRAEHCVYIIQFDGKDWKILEWEQTLLALLACPLHFKAGHRF